MNFEEFREFTETRMNTEWLTTPIAFENTPDSTALISAKNAKSPWIRFVIRDGDGRLQTIGSNSRLDRYAGVLLISIFVAQQIGTKLAREHADSIAAIWRGYSGASCVSFGTPFINIIGETDGWFQINVTVNFQNDEIN